MSTIRLYQGGASMSHNRTGGNPTPSPRGEVRGWNQAQVKRMEKFLWSVPRDERLDGFGYSITLTLTNAPATAVDFHALRTSYVKRLRRSGMSRLHWVIEWQTRPSGSKVPHLHLAAYWPEELTARQQFALKLWWQDLALDYGVGIQSQHVANITGVGGWFEYLTKHSARGVAHAQREGMPDGWQKSGRLWGKVGEWPVQPEIEAQVPLPVAITFRRLVASWKVAQARSLLVRAQHYGDSPKNIRSRRAALIFARGSNRVRKDGFPFPGVSAPMSEAVGLRLLAHAFDVSGPQ